MKPTVPSRLHPWPVTVVPDVGDFTAEDGAWLALPCLPDAVPRECFGEDRSARLKFWKTRRAKVVGRGPTPTAAVTDLVVRLDAARCKLWRSRDDGGWPL